jgi:antitoxin component of RelBE/YafQ-DinJ toxin-antitoxin module
MKTVLNIKTDKEVKIRAQELAQDLGVPLSTVVNAYLKEFIRDREVRLSLEPTPRPLVAKLLKQALRDRKAGKNVSGRLTSDAAVLDFLHR